MSPKLSLIFSLKVSHDYFQNQICPSLQFKPDSVLEHLIKKYRILLRSLPDGFEVYAQNENVASLLDTLKNESSDIAINFEIQVTDPTFYNFTEIPIDKSGLIIYDSQNASAASDGAGFILEGTFSETNAPSIFGKISLNFNDLSQRIAEGKAPEYRIEFQARTVQWKYYIMNAGDKDLIIQGRDVTFTGPEIAKLPNGEEAKVYSSGSSLIKLSEASTQQFQIVDASTKAALAQLPGVNIQTMQLAKLEDKEILAMMAYVYL